MKRIFTEADILLPDFEKHSGETWAVVACDQYTSEPEYWQAVENKVGDAPSALRITLPEVYLGDSDARIPKINATMEKYTEEVLDVYPRAMIYLERTQSDGRVRHGIIGAVDLEAYDYNKGSTSLIRATEGTVLSRIPPRVKIRRDAMLELPHVLLLIDDEDKTVIEKVGAEKNNFKVAYDFDLMCGGGHVKGFFIDEQRKANLLSALDSLASEDNVSEKYGDASLAPLLFAVGDGNHSLATAKACYEELKSKIGAEAASEHPARYALAEIVNIHDEALDFEPIYRVVFNTNPDDIIVELKKYALALNGSEAAQALEIYIGGKKEEFTFEHPVSPLTVGTLQSFLDEYSAKHPDVEVDYIHGEDSLKKLSEKENAVGFIFRGMGKGELFRSVMLDGALPRKTFSMGHADDKRFYLECRKIK